MIIGSTSENKKIEKRISITPEIVKKYKSLGLEIHLSKNYASHLGINDNDFENEGAKIFDTDDEVISSSNLILQMNMPVEENLNKLKRDQILIGVLNPYLNEKK